jgi:hypothetical protein
MHNAASFLITLALAIFGSMNSAVVAGERSIIARLHFDGKTPITTHYNDLTITVTTAEKSNDGTTVSVVRGQVKDREGFTIKADGDEARPNQQADVFIVSLDKNTRLPQVVLTWFWGGAHCCTVTTIATLDAFGSWRIVNGEILDAGGYEFKDIDYDGVAELISVDNSFLYKFGCYACSSAPTSIKKLVGAELKDVTRDPRYKFFVREQLERMERVGNRDANRNGFLGGWVAQKALLGDLRSAWEVMLRTYEKDSLWSLEECANNAADNQCPPDKKRKLTFPEALAKHLVKTRYITEEDARTLSIPRQSGPSVAVRIIDIFPHSGFIQIDVDIHLNGTKRTLKNAFAACRDGGQQLTIGRKNYYEHERSELPVKEILRQACSN